MHSGCVGIRVDQVWLGHVAPTLRESIWSTRIQQRHVGWQQRLPENMEDLWAFLSALSVRDQLDLLAHCVSLGVNALNESGKDPQAGPSAAAERIAAADLLAREVGLDMAQEDWAPDVDNYLGHVTKAHILAAVREAKGEDSVQRIAHLKKPDLAREAEQLLAGTGWLPAPLRLAPVCPAAKEGDQSEPNTQMIATWMSIA